MFLLMTDETNKQASETVKFFVYGGAFIRMDTIPNLTKGIEEIRHKAGYQPGDPFKFSSNSRPEYISLENFNAAKSSLIDLCQANGVILSAYVTLHEIAKRQTEEEIVSFGANTILSSFNKFLSQKNSHGICAIDRLSYGTSFDYIKKKFSFGLNLPAGKTIKLDRIHLYSYTAEGASHLYSIIDVLIGSFGYCINATKKTAAIDSIFPKVTQLFWHENVGDKPIVREYGLYFRPKDLESYGIHKSEYDDLAEKLNSFLK